MGLADAFSMTTMRFQVLRADRGQTFSTAKACADRLRTEREIGAWEVIARHLGDDAVAWSHMNRGLVRGGGDARLNDRDDEFVVVADDDHYPRVRKVIEAALRELGQLPATSSSPY